MTKPYYKKLLEELNSDFLSVYIVQDRIQFVQNSEVVKRKHVGRIQTVASILMGIAIFLFLRDDVLGLIFFALAAPLFYFSSEWKGENEAKQKLAFIRSAQINRENTRLKSKIRSHSIANKDIIRIEVMEKDQVIADVFKSEFYLVTENSEHLFIEVVEKERTKLQIQMNRLITVMRELYNIDVGLGNNTFKSKKV